MQDVPLVTYDTRTAGVPIITEKTASVLDNSKVNTRGWIRQSPPPLKNHPKIGQVWNFKGRSCVIVKVWISYPPIVEILFQADKSVRSYNTYEFLREAVLVRDLK